MIPIILVKESLITITAIIFLTTTIIIIEVIITTKETITIRETTTTMEDITITIRTEIIKEYSKIMETMETMATIIAVSIASTVVMAIKNGKTGMKIKKEIKINHLTAETQIIEIILIIIKTQTKIKINQDQEIWIKDQIIQKIQIEKVK